MGKGGSLFVSGWVSRDCEGGGRGAVWDKRIRGRADMRAGSGRVAEYKLG